MNKKTYIKPSIEAVTIETSYILAASSIKVKPGESGIEQLSNDRRRGWGDLWDGEK